MPEEKPKAREKKKPNVKPKAEKAVKVEEKVEKVSSAKPKAVPKKKREKAGKIPNSAVYATGRRKASIAKVWVFPGDGSIVINNQEMLTYIKRPVLGDVIQDPLKKLNLSSKYNVKISVFGGGLTGQAGACQLGIARALLVMDENFRKTLRENSFLTRDVRVKERKKYGKHGARKGPTYRKR